MVATLVYESMFGNTRAIAEAIARGVGSRMAIEVVRVDAAPRTLVSTDLLIVGGPTQGFSMSRPGTRNGGVKDDGIAPAIGIREWLSALGAPREHVPVATFDTRFKKPRWFVGSAARAAEKRLVALGFAVIAEPESFFVTGTHGPLILGEEDRAREWGGRIAADYLSGWRVGASR
jgi:hypothetical protein